MTFAQLVQLNVAHWVAGLLLVFAGFVTVRNAGKPTAERKWPRAPAKAMLAIGVGLVVLVTVDPLIHKAVGGGGDPMAFYHGTVGVLAAIAGGCELYRLRNPDAPRPLLFVFPLAWIAIGIVFLIHEQATDFLLYRHWAFAITVAAVGITKLIAELGGRMSEKVWGVFAILAGLNFATYWENTPHAPPATAGETSPHKTH